MNHSIAGQVLLAFMSTTDGIATVTAAGGVSAVPVGGEAMAVLAREGGERSLHPLRWCWCALPSLSRFAMGSQ